MSKSINGTGVVAGVAYAPAVWVRPRPELPQPGASIAEDARDSEFERFKQAAEVVADRLTTRAEDADGHAKIGRASCRERVEVSVVAVSSHRERQNTLG